MNHWVVHREQVTGKLQFERCENKDTADLRKAKLRREYHDVVVLSHDDVNELYSDSYRASVRHMKEFFNKKKHEK